MTKVYDLILGSCGSKHFKRDICCRYIGHEKAVGELGTAFAANSKEFLQRFVTGTHQRQRNSRNNGLHPAKLSLWRRKLSYWAESWYPQFWYRWIQYWLDSQWNCNNKISRTSNQQSYLDSFIYVRPLTIEANK